MSDFILAPGEAFIQCPYNTAHQITNARLITHLEKCRRHYLKSLSHEGQKSAMRVCRHNATHHYPAPEIRFHEERCGDAYSVIKYLSWHTSKEGNRQYEERRKLDADAAFYQHREQKPSSDGSSSPSSYSAKNRDQERTRNRNGVQERDKGSDRDRRRERDGHTDRDVPHERSRDKRWERERQSSNDGNYKRDRDNDKSGEKGWGNERWEKESEGKDSKRGWEGLVKRSPQETLESGIRQQMKNKSGEDWEQDDDDDSERGWEKVKRSSQRRSQRGDFENDGGWEKASDKDRDLGRGWGKGNDKETLGRGNGRDWQKTEGRGNGWNSGRGRGRGYEDDRMRNSNWTRRPPEHENRPVQNPNAWGVEEEDWEAESNNEQLRDTRATRNEYPDSENRPSLDTNEWGLVEEDWEASCNGYAPAYDPQQKLKNEQVLYVPSGLTKSERKQFRKDMQEKATESELCGTPVQYPVKLPGKDLDFEVKPNLIGLTLNEKIKKEPEEREPGEISSSDDNFDDFDEDKLDNFPELVQNTNNAPSSTSQRPTPSTSYDASNGTSKSYDNSRYKGKSFASGFSRARIGSVYGNNASDDEPDSDDFEGDDPYDE